MNQWRNNEKPLLLIALLSLAGCATEAGLPSKAKQAPSTGFISYQNKTTENNSKLIVVRDSGYLGKRLFHWCPY
jgi:hypothetical protein